MKCSLLIAILMLIFCFKGNAQQQQHRLLSYDTTQFKEVLQYYCLEKGQKTLDSTQAEYIRIYMLWAKKNFTRRSKGYFTFIIQSDSLTGEAERIATYTLVKQEFMKYGLTEKQIRMIDLNNPATHLRMWISGCPHKILIYAIPKIRKKYMRDLIFCE